MKSQEKEKFTGSVATDQVRRKKHKKSGDQHHRSDDKKRERPDKVILPTEKDETHLVGSEHGEEKGSVSWLELMEDVDKILQYIDNEEEEMNRVEHKNNKKRKKKIKEKGNDQKKESNAHRRDKGQKHKRTVSSDISRHHVHGVKSKVELTDSSNRMQINNAAGITKSKDIDDTVDDELYYMADQIMNYLDEKDKMENKSDDAKESAQEEPGDPERQNIEKLKTYIDLDQTEQTKDFTGKKVKKKSMLSVLEEDLPVEKLTQETTLSKDKTQSNTHVALDKTEQTKDHKRKKEKKKYMLSLLEEEMLLEKLSKTHVLSKDKTQTMKHQGMKDKEKRFESIAVGSEKDKRKVEKRSSTNNINKLSSNKKRHKKKTKLIACIEDDNLQKHCTAEEILEWENSEIQHEKIGNDEVTDVTSITKSSREENVLWTLPFYERRTRQNSGSESSGSIDEGLLYDYIQELSLIQKIREDKKRKNLAELSQSEKIKQHKETLNVSEETKKRKQNKETLNDIDHETGNSLPMDKHKRKKRKQNKETLNDSDHETGNSLPMDKQDKRKKRRQDKETLNVSDHETENSLPMDKHNRKKKKQDKETLNNSDHETGKKVVVDKYHKRKKT